MTQRMSDAAYLLIRALVTGKVTRVEYYLTFVFFMLVSDAWIS